MMSGIAWAVVYTVRHITTPDQSNPKTENTATPASGGAIDSPAEAAGSDTTAVQDTEPKVFDNSPLDQMLGEIAAFYGLTVEFQNEEARNLRFHFVWNKGEGLEKVLDDMSHFESVTIEQTEDRLIVQ